ncbi:MAG: cytochrome c peroxidase [Betaproteobacteria bacterium]
MSSLAGLCGRLPFAVAAALLAGTVLHSGAASVAAPPDAATVYTTKFERKPDVKTLTALGRRLFSERALSASGRMSCASCHDPAHAYGPPNHRAVQLGGADLSLPGLRAVPSLKYHQTITPFQEHFYDNDGDDSRDQGPTGGLGWDGRADSAHAQAAAPLLSPFEMANAGFEDVVGKLKSSASAAAVRDAFGAHVFDDPKVAWNALVLALEVFQQSPTDFYPYDSKYDAFLRRQADLSAAELRGLAVFNDAAKGNCASCHISDVKRGAFPQFTDSGLIALGVPRNKAIPANARADYVDLGLCGPLRTDMKSHAEYCGLFRTPSLRNVAQRPVFFHNGVFTTLEDAVRFYAQRDSNPQRFYPRDAAGRVRQYDDLPKKYQANLNTEAPFGAKPGDKPSMTEAEIRDVVAFLKTLDDGYRVPGGAKVAAAAGVKKN